MSAPTDRRLAGPAALAKKGWWASNRWLVARRSAQLGFLGLFLCGPLTGLWLVKGTMASSLTLGVLPLTDPMMALQALAAGHALGTTAILGAVIVAVVYAMLGGRLYCSWVCPINPLTDAAHWLRIRLGLERGGVTLNRGVRLAILVAVFVVALGTGTIAWEAVNPVSIAYRGIVFGTLLTSGLGLSVLAAIFLFDLMVASRGWCGHLCPVGAFYGLLGSRSLIRVAAPARADCDNCLDCYQICPEPQVLSPALRAKDGHGPVILDRDCTNCGRCIDVCPQDVFRMTTRFDRQLLPATVAPGQQGRAHRKAA